MSVEVTRVNRFLIKSTLPDSRTKSGTGFEVGPDGFPFDRRWIIVNDREIPTKTPDGMVSAKPYVTQRQVPGLNLIQPSLSPEGYLQIEAPKMTDTTVVPGEGGQRYKIRVGDGEVVEGVDCGDEVAERLSRVIGRAVRLADFPPDYRRLVVGKYNPDGKAIVKYADAAPYLVAANPSLGQLNRWLGERNHPAIGLIRFRANIEVDGGEPFKEDEWFKADIGGVPFYLPELSARCGIPDVDANGVRGKGVLDTLLDKRDVYGDGKGRFGVNTVALRFGSLLRVGDKVEPTETKIRY